jgi:hypothetical protein
MNVKPIVGHDFPPEPLRDALQRQTAEAQEMEDGDWIDFGDLLAESEARRAAWPWYTSAWYWLRRLDPIWWIKHRTIDRYHVVGTGLPPGYYDKDTQMLHACFSLLVDFVEVECGGVASLKRQAKWGGRHGEMATECLALYWWWTEIRPRRGEEYFDMEDVYDAKDDEMLARLVKIRRWLWT